MRSSDRTNIARAKRESFCVDAFIAMKVVGHADDQATANIYTHPDDEMVQKTGVRLDEVFNRKDGVGDVVTLMGE